MKIAIGSIRREFRVAFVVVIVAAAGVIALSRGDHRLGAVLAVAAAALAGAFYFLAMRPARIRRNSVLMIRLAGTLREHPPRSPIAHLRGRVAPSLHECRRALEFAAQDPNVSAIVVEFAGLQTGLASAEEIHDLLRAAAAGGKRVIALLNSDSVSVREYVAACGAGEIAANPNAVLMMVGVAAGSVFLKGALDKLGIQAQTLQWKEYKGAGETFARDGMSPEVRESLEAIVGDSLEVVVARICAARKLAPARARALAGGGFLSARAAIEAGLVDRGDYIEGLRAQFDPEREDKIFIGLYRYLRRVSYEENRTARARLALIHGVGPVIAGEAPAAGEFLSGEETAAAIRRAARDRRVRAIVFRVNSPGGSALGSDLVWRAVAEAREMAKPVIVSMGDVAGSGGYYVAMGADAIVANAGTLTGSIGVVYASFNLSAMLATIGVRMDIVKTDELGDALSMARAMTPEELARLNATVGELYGNFTAKVGEGRKLDAAQVEDMARGRVWSGTAARRGGLVDEIGGFDRAVEIARRHAGLDDSEPHRLVIYAAQGILAGLGIGSSRGLEWPLKALAGALAIPAGWTPAIAGLIARGGAILLCPFF